MPHQRVLTGYSITLYTPCNAVGVDSPRACLPRCHSAITHHPHIQSCIIYLYTSTSVTLLGIIFIPFAVNLPFAATIFYLIFTLALFLHVHTYIYSILLVVSLQITLIVVFVCSSTRRNSYSSLQLISLNFQYHFSLHLQFSHSELFCFTFI